jgi:hypothetical protein
LKPSSIGVSGSAAVELARVDKLPTTVPVNVVDDTEADSGRAVTAVPTPDVLADRSITADVWLEVSELSFETVARRISIEASAGPRTYSKSLAALMLVAAMRKL